MNEISKLAKRRHNRQRRHLENVYTLATQPVSDGIYEAVFVPPHVNQLTDDSLLEQIDNISKCNTDDCNTEDCNMEDCSTEDCNTVDCLQNMDVQHVVDDHDAIHYKKCDANNAILESNNSYNRLRDWAITSNIPHIHLATLLDILSHHDDTLKKLPKDPRTFFENSTYYSNLFNASRHLCLYWC